MKQWLCPCGVWVPEWAGRHPHVAVKVGRLEDFRAMRMAEEAGLSGIVPDATQHETTITHYWRTGAEQTREAPLGQ